jgi:hypothetical protein
MPVAMQVVILALIPGEKYYISVGYKSSVT